MLHSNGYKEIFPKFELEQSVDEARYKTEAINRFGSILFLIEGAFVCKASINQLPLDSTSSVHSSFSLNFFTLLENAFFSVIKIGCTCYYLLFYIYI